LSARGCCQGAWSYETHLSRYTIAREQRIVRAVSSGGFLGQALLLAWSNANQQTGAGTRR
jgi:hypothetical protein